jgi:rRNA processing protein Gar1
MCELNDILNEIIDEIEKKEARSVSNDEIIKLENKKLNDQFMKIIELVSSDFDSDSSASEEENIMNNKLAKTKIQKDDYIEEDDEYEDDNEQSRKDKEMKYLKTKGEITLDDLSPPESINLKLDENVHLQKMGRVLSIVDNKLFVIQSLIEENLSPFDEETILFDVSRNAIGKIHETFGPVANPFYTIRKTQQAQVELNSFVYFVPNSNDYTKFIFNVEELRKLKGSDASWNNDNEPPEEYLDYSDDEKEKLAKKIFKLKKIREKNENDSQLNTEEDSSDDADNEDEQEKLKNEKKQPNDGKNYFKQRNKDKRIGHKMQKSKSFARYSYQSSSSNQNQLYYQSNLKKSNSSYENFNETSNNNNNNYNNNNRSSQVQMPINTNMHYNYLPNQMQFMPQYNPYCMPFYNNFFPPTQNFMMPSPGLIQQAQFQSEINPNITNTRSNNMSHQINQPPVMDRRFVQNKHFVKRSF